VRLAGKPELQSDCAGAKQYAPILKPNQIPHEYLGRTPSVLIGMILIAERVAQPLFFGMPFF
jgi:hypothetical protein